MIRVVGKKAKQKRKIEPPSDSERATEAEYYARKFGLTREEAARMIKDARTITPLFEPRMAKR
jgi:hypothetical protein